MFIKKELDICLAPFLAKLYFAFLFYLLFELSFKKQVRESKTQQLANKAEQPTRGENQPNNCQSDEDIQRILVCVHAGKVDACSGKVTLLVDELCEDGQEEAHQQPSECSAHDEHNSQDYQESDGSNFFKLFVHFFNLQFL